MRKTWLALTLLAVLLLSACGTSSTAGTTAGNTPAAAKPAAAKTAVPTTAPATCTMVTRQPTPGPTEASIFPAVSAEDWSLGAETAKVTVLEYSDFQCPICAKLAPVLVELAKKYPQDVRFVYRHFPLSGHDKALLAAQAAEAAGKQGKFWEMSERLFAEQATWSAAGLDQFAGFAEGYARDLGLDVDTFKTDLTGETVVAKVKAAQDSADKIGLPGTPFLLINNQVYEGPRDLATLSSIVDMIKLEDRQFNECPPMTIDVNKTYTATLKTELGDVVLQLFPKKAPMAVNSFVFLARKGWFDNTIFHRVLPGFVAQGGDPSASGLGGPGYAFSNEIQDLRFDKEGVVGMANSGPNSNGSQFFITYAAQPHLDGGYTIFGQVLQGMDVLKKFPERDPQKGGELPAGVKLISVTIEEK